MDHVVADRTPEVLTQPTPTRCADHEYVRIHLVGDSDDGRPRFFIVWNQTYLRVASDHGCCSLQGGLPLGVHLRPIFRGLLVADARAFDSPCIFHGIFIFGNHHHEYDMSVGS
jgi:hypothetical protein